MPPSPSERALKTRLFPEGWVKRVTRLTLSARNTYTGDQRFRRKFRAATEVWDESRHPGQGPLRHIPRWEGYRKVAVFFVVLYSLGVHGTRTLPKM